MICLKVAVGSLNPVKLEGVRRAFERFFGGVEVVGVGCGGTPKQPVGADQTLKGAYARATQSLRTVTDAHFGVGVEAGVVALPQVGQDATHLNVQYAVVLDREGRSGVGSSPGFQLPKDVLGDILGRGMELDESFSSRYGYTELGRSVGVVHMLTEGLITRERLVEDCVCLALIPFINPQLRW